MKYIYRNEDSKFKYFERFDLEFVKVSKKGPEKNRKSLVGYIGSKCNVLNIFIIDPLNNHLLFAYGIKEFSEFLYVDTENFKDEIVRKIHMDDSFLLEYLNYFANHKSSHCYIHAPYFIKDTNGNMNEIDTSFEKLSTVFAIDINYRLGQKISFDNGTIKSKTVGNGNFYINRIYVSKDQFNIVYNGLKAFQSKLMNNINSKNHWGTELEKYDNEFDLNFKMKSLENEYNVNIHFSSKNQIIEITDKKGRIVYDGTTILIDNKKFKINNSEGNLKLPYPDYRCKLNTNLPSLLSIDEDNEIKFESFYINEGREKSLIISLDMYGKHPLENYLKFKKDPKKITKYFVINKNLDEIYSAFSKYDDKMKWRRRLKNIKDNMIQIDKSPEVPYIDDF